MRTNIDIDDALLAEALKATGARTKRRVVELGLEMLVRVGRQTEFRRFHGKLPWSGDLEAMRKDP